MQQSMAVKSLTLLACAAVWFAAQAGAAEGEAAKSASVTYKIEGMT